MYNGTSTNPVFNAIKGIDFANKLPCVLVNKETFHGKIIHESILSESDVEIEWINVKVTIDEFFYADKLADKYVKLSREDRIALAIAKYRKAPLLTCDSILREVAEIEGVEVYNMIAVFDQLYSGKLHVGMECALCVEAFIVQGDCCSLEI